MRKVIESSLQGAKIQLHNNITWYNASKSVGNYTLFIRNLVQGLASKFLNVVPVVVTF